MAVTDDKIARCVASYREKLDAHPRTPESLSQAPASRLHVIIELAGAKRRNEALLARLDQAFTDAEIVTYPRLTDPVLKRGDPRVFMFDRSRQIKGLTPTRQLFHDEKTLQSFILANLDEFDEFRELASATSGHKRGSTAVAGSTSSARGPRTISWSGSNSRSVSQTSEQSVNSSSTSTTSPNTRGSTAATPPT